MRYRILALIMIFVLLIVSAIVVVSCGDNKVNAEIAAKVAKNWTAGNSSAISQEIGQTISVNIPVSESALISILEDEVENNVTWTYSKPEKLSNTIYNVTAKTKINYEIPEIGIGSMDIGIDLACTSSQATITNITYYTYTYVNSLDGYLPQTDDDASDDM